MTTLDLSLIVHRDNCSRPDGSAIVLRPGREGGTILRCTRCRRMTVVGGDDEEPTPPPLPTTGRYFLGECVRCEVTLWVDSPRPRVPLCTGCALRVERARIARQREARRKADRMSRHR